ncbi:PLAC8 family protein [Rhynchospora pubera]|uniref:PLAC8 family protein n=1 Tax=Rhynchospora pubera TaxID=906938 RepID=A0AAV8E4N7_9POAL|nr:PLAC8 family protein [Rhynchospora pubera]KAJ4776501.1 PLAC8 family protein [Rhynchospora pubera]
MATWEQIGELANISQLTGLNALQLISLVVQSANAARTHKRNCRRFAKHLTLISNLLQQLNVPELRDRAETREPLERLEEAIKRGYALVDACGKRSFLYMLAMGWSVAYEFKRVQDEIDRCLKIVPLISLVHSKHAVEKLERIEKDQCEYTLDEEDKKVQEVILDRDPSKNHSSVLEKSLSRSYPDLPFTEALEKEKEKLKLELHRSQANLDTSHSEVIHHLLQVTHGVAHCENERDYQKQDCDINCSRKGLSRYDEWGSDLLGCCEEPSLCFRTFFYPCGTFSRVATVAKNRYISSGEACNDLMAYSCFLSCYCYTCCVRRKLRQKFHIRGGFCDDFLSHLLCCCCALVQEWREVEIRSSSIGPEDTKISPPDSQYMES